MMSAALIEKSPPSEQQDFFAHHFDSPEQQFDAGKLGMWLFLATEILFFSGLFVAYAVYRASHPEVFVYAHRFLDTTLGAANTIILLLSSLTMAWAVRCAQLGGRRGLIVCLLITLACAAAFLGIKAVEYRHKWDEGLLWAGAYQPHEAAPADTTSPGSEIRDPAPDKRLLGVFFSIYYALTGLHAVHILLGMAAIGWIAVRAARGHFGPHYYGPVDYVGLYWHLVDLVWIFLFPLLYLIR